MPMPSTERVRQAFERLAGTGDFQVVLEYLRGLEADAIERAVLATELLQIGRAQGSAQTLKAILDLVHPASNRR